MNLFDPTPAPAEASLARSRIHRVPTRAAKIRVRVVAEDPPLRHALATALSCEPDVKVLEPGVRVFRSPDHDVAAPRPNIAESAHPDVLVLVEPFGPEPGEWAATVREVAPGAKVVLLAIGHRPDELSGRVPADAVIDATRGVVPLLAAIKSVTR